MPNKIIDYQLERETNEPREYHLIVYDESNTRYDFSLEARAKIKTSQGKIISINENGLKETDFRQAIQKLYAYSSFYKSKEREILAQLEEIVCKTKQSKEF